MVLFLILVVLVFLYVKDKKNLYYHYRMEIIDNEVEFNFLRIYSNVFTLYLYLIFVFTQKEILEYAIGGIVTIITMLFQTIYFRKLREDVPNFDDSVIVQSLDELEIKTAYKEKYEQFLDVARSDLVDGEIKEYLSKQGFGTMRTEDSITEPLQ